MTSCKIYLLTVWGAIETLFFSVVILGWANMVLILKNEGYFRDLCSTTNLTAMKPGIEEDSKECSPQNDRLALVYTIAVFTQSIGGFTGGIIFDRFGTRVTRFIICFFIFSAGVIAYFMDKETAYLIFPVTICLALSGSLVALTNLQIANLHQKHRFAAISSISGAAISSPVVFLIFKVCYESGSSLRWILITYAGAAIVCILTSTLAFLPKTSFAREEAERKKAIARNNMECGKDNTVCTLNDMISQKSSEPAAVGNNSDKKVGNKKSSNSWSYIFTWKFFWLFYYTATLRLRVLFFIASLHTFLVFKTDNDKDTIDRYTSIFGIAQFFGFMFSPLTGILMDFRNFGVILTFIITNVLCIVLGGLVLVPVLEVQYLSFVVQIALMAFLYSSLFSFILKAFPPIHYGTFTGVILLVAAVVSLFQYPIFILMEGSFGGDPFWVNVGFLILSFTGFGLPFYLILKRKKERVNGIA